jgi:CheY-like chemotaxis protein
MKKTATRHPVEEADKLNSPPTPRTVESQSVGTVPSLVPISADRNPVTVLIVDDSAIVRERLVALIEGLEHPIIVGQAADGFQALRLFQQHRPDAVVLDIQLPGIDGFDLLAQFKKEHPACVVMMMTTYAFIAFRQRCAALGADHFFDKSTEFERITEILEAWPPRRGSENDPMNHPHGEIL